MFSFHCTLIDNPDVYEVIQDLSSAELEAAIEEWGEIILNCWKMEWSLWDKERYRGGIIDL